MLKKIMPVVICFLMTGCMNYYYIQPNYRLSQLPTIATHDVDVVFPAEEIPDKNYIKLGILEVVGSESDSYQLLVEEIKKKAEIQGADAVIIIDKSQDLKLQSDETVLNAIANVISREKDRTDNHYTTSIQRRLVGLGIKYVKNITYLNQFAKNITVSEFNSKSNSYTIREVVELLPNGMPANQLSDSSLYNKDFYKLSTEHLIDEKSANWAYSTKVLKNDIKVINRRELRANGKRIKKCNFFYNKTSILTRIEVHYAYEWFKKENINFYYNEKGKLASKSTVCAGYPTLEEVYVYDGEKLIERDLYKIENNQRTPYLKAVYNYYQPTDWQSFIKK
jgi:hypothetical protein